MRDRIEAFLRGLEAREASPHTIGAYRNDLARFADFAAGRAGGGAAPPASSIDRGTIADYGAWLEERAYAPATIARKTAAVRSFCGFLLEGGDIAANPADGPSAPVPRADPEVLSEEDAEALLRQPLGSDSPGSVRDAAMLELLYAAGMRVSELVTLNVEDLRTRPRPASVRCFGKGSRERTLPVRDRAADAAERYLGEARPQLAGGRPPNDALFVNPRGQRLTRQGCWLILRKHARNAGIGESVSPHVLRHSFAVRMLRSGASARDVRKLLGYSGRSAAAMQPYVRLAAGGA